MSLKDNPELWEKVKKEIQGNEPWNARIAQRAVIEYKKRGGGYIGKKDPKNSLVKWTKQNWTYSPEQGKRYLPELLWKELTPSQRRKMDLTKQQSITKGESKSKYPPELLKIIEKYIK